jgi:cell division protein ZapA (FtsZ GTPase activity inhibitor)
MATFRVPYKAVLISLYEEAMQNGNEDLMSQVKQNFDVRFTNIDERFRSIGLDDSIVKPSNVINVMALQSRIKDRIRREPELKYHHDNEVALENIVKEFRLIREMEI